MINEYSLLFFFLASRFKNSQRIVSKTKDPFELHVPMHFLLPIPLHNLLPHKDMCLVQR